MKEKDTLKKAKEEAEKYINIAGVMIIAIDNAGKVTLINNKGCEILGYKKEEMIGKNWFDNFLPKRLRKQVKEVSKKILAGNIKPLKHYENPNLKKDGKEKLIAWTNIELRDEKGNITGHLSSGEDITDKKKAEKELKKRNEELEKFNKLAVGRELRISELKKRIKELEDQLKRVKK